MIFFHTFQLQIILHCQSWKKITIGTILETRAKTVANISVIRKVRRNGRFVNGNNEIPAL